MQRMYDMLTRWFRGMPTDTSEQQEGEGNEENIEGGAQAQVFSYGA